MCDQNLIVPFRMLRQVLGDRRAFFPSTGLEGVACECSVASLAAPRERLGGCDLALGSRRCAGLTFSIKWTVASRKWAPSDLVTTASTDFKTPSGNSR